MKLPTLLSFAYAAEALRVSAHRPVVHTPSGRIVGSSCPNNADVHLFQGIPYAKPPVGKLRFMPPQPLEKTHHTVINATTPPAPCIQFPSSFSVDNPTPSEDCLYINVYVPAHAKPHSKLPVKVFAYGGANNGGAVTYPLYDSCNLATDAIVVLFNYRLGALGFLSLESAGIKGNMAIQDYTAALTWVKDNIAAFGGAPEKVLLFGQSAGADDTFIFSTLPVAKGLVNSVILESGGGLDLTPYETAQYTASSYAETLGCRRIDLACLQKKSVEEIVDAVERTPALLDGKLSGYSLSSGLGVNLPNVTNLNQAIVDGDIVPNQPLTVGSQVPVTSGFTADDASLFVVPYYALGDTAIDENNYTDFLSQWGENVGSLIGKQYPLSAFNVSGSTSVAVLEAITHIVVQSSFACPAYRTLRSSIEAGTPAFGFLFDHTPSCPWISLDGQAFPGPKLAPYFGATHSSELPFVFGNLDKQPFGNGTCSATAAERKMSQTLVDAWTAMAGKGSPSTHRQSWPEFDVDDARGVLVKNGTMVQKLDFSECKFWDEIWTLLGGGNWTSLGY